MVVVVVVMVVVVVDLPFQPALAKGVSVATNQAPAVGPVQRESIPQCNTMQ